MSEEFYHLYTTDTLDMLMSPIPFQVQSLERWVQQRFGKIHATWKETGSLQDWKTRPQLAIMLERLNSQSQVMVTRVQRFDAHMGRLAKCMAEIAGRGANLHILNFGGSPLSLPAEQLGTFERIFQASWEIQQAYIHGRPRKPQLWNPTAEPLSERELGRMRYAFFQIRVLERPPREVMQQAFEEHWTMTDGTAWVYGRDLKKGRHVAKSQFYQALRRYEQTHAEECRRLRSMPPELMKRIWV